MNHLKVRQKYSAALRILNSFLGVSSGHATLCLILDILLQKFKPKFLIPVTNFFCWIINNLRKQQGVGGGVVMCSHQLLSLDLHLRLQHFSLNWCIKEAFYFLSVYRTPEQNEADKLALLLL